MARPAGIFVSSQTSFKVLSTSSNDANSENLDHSSRNPVIAQNQDLKQL